jgi:AsmA family
MKTIRRILLVLVLIIIVVGIVIYTHLDGIIKSVVQTQATDSLNLTTTLDSAHLALFGGSLTLNDLQVASPQGYKAEHMVGFDKLHVAVNYSQLRKDPIHIQTITIDNPKLVIEQQNGKLNFKAAMDQMPKTPPSSAKPTGEDRAEGQPIRVIIDQLDINNAEVTLQGLPGLNQEMKVPVPSISLKDIGNGDGSQNGAAVKDVVMEVINALAAKASDSKNLSGIAQNLLKSNVENLTNQLNGQISQQISNITSKLPGDLGNRGATTQGSGDLEKNVNKEINKDLGGLLGGKKNK